MNLREFAKKLRSPMGTAILFLSGLIVLILLVLPFLLRDDAGKLQVIRPSVGEAAYDIAGNIKAVNLPPQRKQESKNQPEKLTEQRTENTPPTRNAPRPPQPPGRASASSSGNFRRGSDRNFSPRDGQTGSSGQSAILIIDGENAAGGNKEFISDRYAPYGRLISCKMVNTVESGDTDTPLLAFVAEDLWWINSKGEKKLIIPAGTEVHGTIQGAKPLRNRLTTGNNFILVWQATSDMVGFELQLKGIALEKSNHPDTKGKAAISDMAAGIPGQVVSNENLAKFLMYTLAFAQGMSQGYQTTELYSNAGGMISTQEGTTKNALARGTETLAQIMLQDVSKQISKESYFIRVAAGTEFYLFVQQVINLDEAKIANTLLNKLEQQKIQGQEKKRSAKDILNSFSRNQP